MKSQESSLPPKVFLPKSTKETKTPSFKFREPSEDLIKKYDRQTNLIIGILIVALATMIIMTGTLIIDSFHFNSATYKDYSEKIETLNLLQETNKKQLELIEANQKKQEELFKNCVNK